VPTRARSAEPDRLSDLEGQKRHQRGGIRMHDWRRGAEGAEEQIELLPAVGVPKRQTGAVAPPSASTPLESLKVKMVPGAGQTISAFCARALRGLAPASAQASRTLSLERTWVPDGRITVGLTSPRSSRPDKRRPLRAAANRPWLRTRSAGPSASPQEPPFEAAAEQLGAAKVARRAERPAWAPEGRPQAARAPG
jgi:hypothetical protein